MFLFFRLVTFPSFFNLAPLTRCDGLSGIFQRRSLSLSTATMYPSICGVPDRLFNRTLAAFEFHLAHTDCVFNDV